jgi:DNA-binding GntR family transcriptional regulator
VAKREVGEMAAAGDPLASLERRGLRDRVYDLILDLLLSGEVQPSTRLGIDTLAKRLDVSPTPVREALVQLERTGLVTREALKGYRVAPPLSSAQITELFDARMMLESGAVELAERNIDALLPALAAAQEQHGALAARVREASLDGPVPVALYQEYFDADWGFHRVVLEHSDNRFLLEMSESVGTHLHRMRQSVLHGDNDVNEAVAEHTTILRAFESRRPGAARDAMREHIRRVRDRAVDDA